MSEHSGISFDSDIEWHSALPHPLMLKDEIAVHENYENGLIASSPQGQEKFRELLDNAENKIPLYFAVDQENSNHSTLFSPRYEGAENCQLIVDGLGYEKFVHLEEQRGIRKIDDYAQYTLEQSQYASDITPIKPFRVASRD